jgi:hypothetical protein
MLEITEEAASLVRTLAVHRSVPEGGGLRIDLNPDTDSLSMGMAVAPDPSDAVVVRAGAMLFLSPPALQRMDGRRLCAEITGSRSLFFLDA